MNITAFEIAERFIGVKEIPGLNNDPQIMNMLRLDNSWPGSDEVPWCSAFLNYVAWLLRLPRSKSLMARSWLNVGIPILPISAEVGFDVVVFGRGNDPQAGHCGFYAGQNGGYIWVLGGNQSNAVTVESLLRQDLLGVRRLGT